MCSSDLGVARIRAAGGIASLAHPVRVKGDIRALMPELRESGLNAIEAYHSDHNPQDTQLYLGLASHYGLRVTGGSDYHGAIKPNVTFGSLRIPDDLLDRLRNPGTDPTFP